MCEPVTMGVMAAGSTGLGAIGSHQSASAAASAQNEGAIRQYKYQLKVRRKNWDRERERYAHQVVQYNQQTQENAAAAQRAYSSEQQRLNNIFKQASFSQQNQLVQLAKTTGKQAASGQMGRSADRVGMTDFAQFGRNQAIMAESLLGAQQSFKTRTDGIRREQISANNRAFNDVAYAPEPGVAPPQPVMRQGPSSLSLMSGLLGAAVDGVGAYNQANSYE